MPKITIYTKDEVSNVLDCKCESSVFGTRRSLINQLRLRLNPQTGKIRGCRCKSRAFALRNRKIKSVGHKVKGVDVFETFSDLQIARFLKFLPKNLQTK